MPSLRPARRPEGADRLQPRLQPVLRLRRPLLLPPSTGRELAPGSHPGRGEGIASHTDRDRTAALVLPLGRRGPSTPPILPARRGWSRWSHLTTRARLHGVRVPPAGQARRVCAPALQRAGSSAVSTAPTGHAEARGWRGLNGSPPKEHFDPARICCSFR